jgi:hypothetical protein
MGQKPGDTPLKVKIQRLVLNHVGKHSPMPYQAVLTSPSPPGSITSEGQFGPWNAVDPGATKISGSYTFTDANLAVFQGISGILSSKGSFNGTLRQAKTEGTVDVRDFRVDGSSHAAQLSARFLADVNAANGDVSLESVQSQVRRTTVVSRGEIAGHPGENGKTARLEMTVDTGRVEDLLLFFTSQPEASMTGSVKLRAKVQLPPGPGFLKKLRITGDFGVSSGKFTDTQLQGSLNHVSESSKGESKREEQEDPRTVLSDIKGHVEARNGVATLTGLSFAMPGGYAQMGGTFNLLSKALDIQGVLRTDGKLSDGTSGFKAMILKVVTPFMRKNRVTIVPFNVRGTAANPRFGLDLDGKRTIVTRSAVKP